MDKRVVAVAPVVIDLLNVEESFEHHYRAYGFWAPSIAAYQASGIMRWAGTRSSPPYCVSKTRMRIVIA